MRFLSRLISWVDKLENCLNKSDTGYIVCLVVLTLFQILDGFFTYLGVLIVNSTDIEGNPLIKALMDELGAGTALIVVKGLAVLICLVMFYLTPLRSDSKVAVVDLMLYLITLLYLCILVAWGYTIIGLLS
jgi:hypothetical protein